MGLEALDLASDRFEALRNEYNLTSSQLASAKKEIQATRAELSALKSEHQYFLSEVQSIKEELSYLRQERQQDKLQSVTQKIDEMKKEVSLVAAGMSGIIREHAAIKERLALSKTELLETNNNIEAPKSKLVALEAKKDEKEKEVRRAQNELAFIESELASLGMRNENQKVMKAASSMVAAANKKYEEARRELEAIKAVLTKMRMQYQVLR